MIEQASLLISGDLRWLLVVLGFVAFFGLGVICWRYEIRKWNRGRCPRCHQPWKSFDVDSQGGVGYTCKCGSYIWLSWINPKEIKQ